MLDRLITAFYWFNVRTWVTLVVAWAAKKHVEGLENVPGKGPVILVSNHLNNADPPLLTQIVPRRIVWLAKRELFDIPVVGWLCRAFGLIPVRRFEADLSALRKAQAALRRGHMIGMFPEGTRSHGAGLKEGEPGTAMIALRTGAPLLPVAIWGTENVRLPRDLLRRTEVYVRIGPPFTLPRAQRLTRADVEAGTRAIMERIAALLPEKYRGVYGGTASAEKTAQETKA
jgi:1-acyl-sn-glycerol-3-phosphate acyltransferase